MKNIEEAINELYEKEHNYTIVIGAAGDYSNDGKNIFIEYLSNKYKSKVVLESDGYLALNSISRLENENVLIVVGGTGSIIYANDKERVFRVGGFGHIIGDEGSAYHLVIEAIRYLINDYEKNAELSTFSKEFMNLLQIEDIQDIKSFVYGHSKDYTAGFSKLISKMALNGNKKAIDLLENEGKLLAEQVYSAYKKMGNERIKIALRGGFLKNAPYVKEKFIKELKELRINYLIDTKEIEPVYGAYNIAIKINNIGKEN
ncbi:BadF/BadG/BcrA/BcrD ATPase family [Haploplasma axanthum]|uniref:BadF/BadG/BcrA/BcrD ATPase family n=2 Tax=Haploplasma axanthum TaxID=29552 RepID=A0A449BD09_HAPAX|nr:BadF/BadG/BcrA/BcrD ATPase family [Haploplasma axanthum]